MSRPCVEEFGNAFSRDRRRKPLTFNIIHRLVALDRVKAPSASATKALTMTRALTISSSQSNGLRNSLEKSGRTQWIAMMLSLCRYANVRAQGAQIRQIREDTDSSGPDVSGSIRPGA